MTAYAIASLRTVAFGDDIRTYLLKIDDTLPAFGGRFLVHGSTPEVMDGDLPGAVVIDRNVLEWRLDPTSPHRIPEMDDGTRRVIVVCNEGYSSSLAAATLQQLGIPRRRTWWAGSRRGGASPKSERAGRAPYPAGQRSAATNATRSAATRAGCSHSTRCPVSG